MSWNIVQSKDKSDQIGILKLRKIVFADEDLIKQEKSYWDWEFFNNVHGKAEIFIAIDNENIIGHYGFLPQRYVLIDDTATAGLAVDAMIHPKYRRQGIFSALQDYSLHNSQAEFFIGYTIRKEILPAEIKGGYVVIKKISVFILPINFTNILSNYIKIPILSKIIGYISTKAYLLLFRSRVKNENLVIKRVDKIGDTIACFFNNQKKMHQIYLDKSVPYLRWRYDQNGLVEYEKYIVKDKDRVLAYFVLRGEKILNLKSLNIIDLEIIEEDTELVRSILKFIISHARNKKYDCLAYFLSDNGFISKKLKYYGLINSPFKFHLIVRNNTKSHIVNIFKESKYIHLNWSDTDML